MLIDLPTTGESLTAIGRPLPRGTSRHIISDGAKGTAQTVKMMQDLINSGKRDNDIRALCGKILNPKDGSRPCKPKDYFNYARLLYEWVRDNILYAYDPHNVEYLEKASITVKNGIGDCDSQDILLCSMFEHVGLQAQLVTIKADPNRPNEYTHVYTRVLIPKVGWVVADPIMPEKWFGWEPPYPNGRKYWAASTDELSQSLDTSDSVPFPQPGGAPQSDGPFDGVIGMGGLGAMGRSGRGHGGRGWGGGGWGGGYDSGVVVVGIPVPSQIEVVENYDIVPQQLQSPLQEDSFGLQGMGGVLDVFSNAADSVKGALGIAPTGVSQEQAKSLISRIVDGTEAKSLNDKRAKINAKIDAANAVLKSNATASAKSQALAARNAAYDAQYALNDLMGNYNRLAAFVNNLPGAGVVVPSLNGLGAWQYVAGAFVVSAYALWIVHDYFVTQAEFYKKEQIAELAKLTPTIAAAYVSGGQIKAGSTGGSDWSNWFDQSSGQIVKSTLTLGAIGLALYAAAKVIGYSAGVADAKIKQTLRLV